MNVKEAMELLSTRNSEEKVAIAIWTTTDFMDVYNIPDKHKHIVESVLEEFEEEHDWSGVNDELFRQYESAVECSQETEPYPELGWELSA